ncbi:MAG: hypothetical protein IJP37_00130 [Clostridia bacterium]|nr:hypothetical protein [Clostridia bacterium]
MRNWFRNIGARMQQWMCGRYGTDELSRALSIAGLVLLVLSFIPHLYFFYAPALVLVIWSTVRSFSKKIDRREAEREAYLRFVGKIKSFFRVKKKAWQERKTHRHFRCKQCKTMLRVPKGRGTIKIRCPKCGMEIIKKT